MLPSPPSVFPRFEPDQLLTSENLNQLFGYLDEQGRLSRTNLIGVGIVCGLEVQVDTSTPSITITKGTGITSKGYLVAVDSFTYEEYISYDAAHPEYYNKFVTNKEQKILLWELKAKAAVPDAKKLDNAFLENKIVLIFVELFEEHNKNCNPESCDDKGISVTVSFRPLLVSKDQVSGLVSGSGWSSQLNPNVKVPELVMKRFDVPNTSPLSSLDIFEAYHKLLNPDLFKQTEKVLSDVYIQFTQLLQAEFPDNPFQGLAKKFEFIEDGSLQTEQLIHVQYIYDLFSDIFYAYKEFSVAANNILGLCCPSESMFPRHLLLGAASTSAKAAPNHRHNFIYSPLFQRAALAEELRSLFRRMALLIPRYEWPDTKFGKHSNSKLDPFIRITPSVHGDVPLSQKSIPYYYKVGGSNPLYKAWNYRKTSQNIADRILSWRAKDYNNTDAFVLHPLEYDLEPYNFLRIEGHIGKSYISVLQNLKRQVSKYRLPVNVIALSTESNKVQSKLSDLGGLADRSFSKADLSSKLDMVCQFQDLEALYDSIKNEVLCTLCKELRYYYEFRMSGLRSKANNDSLSGAFLADGAAERSQVTLFDQCTKNYMVRPGTFGFYFEKVYRALGEDTDLNVQNISEALGLDKLFDSTTGNTLSASQQNGLFSYLVLIFEIPMGIIRMASSFTHNLFNFDVEEYCRLHQAVVAKAESFKYLFHLFTGAQEKEVDNTESVVNENMADRPSTAAGGATLHGLHMTEGTIPSGIPGTPNTNTQRAAALAISAGSLQSNALVTFIRSILMIEDLLDHLDVLIYNCKCSALRSIVREYAKRAAYVTILRQFGYFTRLHPGIQHKAGVTIGGTFIIVYHVASQIRERLKETIVEKAGGQLKGRVVDAAGSPLPAALVRIKDTTKATTTDAAGNFVINISFLPITLTVSFMGLGERTIEVNSLTEKLGDISIVEDGDDDDQPDLLANIAEGTVIADFYLPYLLFSECPPIQYIVPELKEDDTRSLSLQPHKMTGDNRYCSMDELPYLFTMQPKDSELSPMDGVSKNGDDFIFTPAAVNIGDNDKIELNFISGKDGLNAPPLKVTVYHNPTADFEVNMDTGKPRVVSFTDRSSFATEYTWDFGDNTEVDHSSSPTHEYALDGEYTVGLRVNNEIGGCSSLLEKVVTIKLEEQTSPKCMPLDLIISEFKNLKGIDSDNFTAFKKLFKEYPDVEEIFKAFMEIQEKPIDSQLNFLAQIGFVPKLQQWLGSLFSIISGDNLKVRLLALELYRILASVAMYIACIKEGDVNTIPVPINTIFELILSHLRVFRRLVANFTEQEIAVLTKLKKRVEKELERLKQDDGISVKPIYGSLLEKIIAMLQAMNV